MRERDGVLLRMLEEEYITLDEYQTATPTTWEEMKPSRVVHPLLEPTSRSASSARWFAS